MAALFEPQVEVWGNNQQRWGTGPPVNVSDCVGISFSVGDIIYNSAPAIGGVFAWFCTAGGNPGTWQPVAMIGGAAGNTAFGSSGRQLAHAQYNFALDGGAQSTVTLKNNVTLPINSVITNVYFNSTTAIVGASATVAFGTSAGSSASSLLAATAITSFGLNAFVHGVPTPQTASTFVKLSAAGQITITIATANLTAGIVECYLEYYVSST